jgi:hypothetical protein
VLDDYLLDESGYIYWSTPRYRSKIKAGDRAYLWRTLTSRPAGIVAIGLVDQEPKRLTTHNSREFRFCERLNTFGDKLAPSSDWKTGIRLEEVRLTEAEGMLTADILEGVVKAPPSGTVFPILDEKSSQIERLWYSRRRQLV